MDLQEKINQLEELITSPTTQELEAIKGMRKQLQMSEHYKSFLEHPITADIVKRLIDWIKLTNLTLLSDESIIEGKRHDLILERDIYIKILNIFSPEKTKLINLENVIDEKIKEFKNYK